FPYTTLFRSKMIAMVNEALNKLDCYKLTDEKDHIREKFATLEYALDLAKSNLKSAKELEDKRAILECDNQLSEITIEYSAYNEKVQILKLIEIFDKPVSNYDELLAKREAMMSILENLVSSSLYEE